MNGLYVFVIVCVRSFIYVCIGFFSFVCFLKYFIIYIDVSVNVILKFILIGNIFFCCVLFLNGVVFIFMVINNNE